MAESEIGGTVSFKVNGVQYSLRGTVRIDVGGPSKTPVMDTQGNLAGYTTKYMPGKIEVEINDMGSLSIVQLRNLTGITATAELGNGKNYIGTNMSQAGDGPELDAIEGRLTATLQGQPLQELLAS